MSEETAKRKIQWVPAPGGVVEVYGNLATIQWSLDDVRVRFAQMVNSPETPNPGGDLVPIAQERVAVTMTWRGAKILAGNLAKAVEAFEQVNGEIVVDLNLPPSVQ